MEMKNLLFDDEYVEYLKAKEVFDSCQKDLLQEIAAIQSQLPVIQELKKAVKRKLYFPEEIVDKMAFCSQLGFLLHKDSFEVDEGLIFIALWDRIAMFRQWAEQRDRFQKLSLLYLAPLLGIIAGTIWFCLR